jgi:hypothetical protein
MPGCMVKAWLLVDPYDNENEQRWYKHLGRGDSLRTAGVPLPLTRAMAHQFSLAPHHFTIRAALRWAQVRGLGGSESLARAVAGTRLGREFENEEFWLTVLRFLVDNPGMDTRHLGPLFDFLHDQRFASRDVFVPGEGVVHQGPPRPDYSMKGRSVLSLVRQMEAWRREREEDDRLPALTWARAPIGELEHVASSGCRWTIRELLDSGALFREGVALRHCVAEYAPSCASRRTSIWSMQLDTGRGPRRTLTVEVDLKERVVCQARGRANRFARPCERAVLERWAEQEGLEVAVYMG